MKYVKDFQYVDVSATEDPLQYDGELYVYADDLTKNIVSNPVNDINKGTVTPAEDSILIDTLSGSTDD